MGGCLGGSSGALKEPEDHTLDELEFEKMRLEQFDSVFESAADLLNIVVSLNNDIITSKEKIKEAICAIIGEYTVTTVIKDGIIIFEIEAPEVKEGEDEPVVVPLTPAKITALLAGKADLKRAYDAIAPLLVDANKAVSDAPMVTVSLAKGRLAVSAAESKEEDVPKIAAAKNAIKSLNNKIFKVKLELMKACAADALDPKKAIARLFTEVKLAIKGFVPTVHCDLAGIMDGNIDFSIVPPEPHQLELLPPKIKKAYDAIMGDDGLVATIKDCVAQVKSVVEKGEALKAAVEALPQDPSAVQSMAQEANLPAMFMLKLPGISVENVRKASSAPQLVTGLVETIKATCNEVKEGVENAMADVNATRT